jgi:hypothetical protein
MTNHRAEPGPGVPAATPPAPAERAAARATDTTMEARIPAVFLAIAATWLAILGVLLVRAISS